MLPLKLRMHNEPMVTLHTTRLTLRTLIREDENLFCDLYTDPKTMRHVGPPLTLERAQRGFALCLESVTRRRKRRFLAILRRSDEAFLGLCGFQNYSASTGRAEIGIMFNETGRGQGLSAEALGATVSHAFTCFMIEELYGIVARENLIAQRMCMNVGLTMSRDDSKPLVLSISRETWTKNVNS